MSSFSISHTFAKIDTVRYSAFILPYFLQMNPFSTKDQENLSLYLVLMYTMYRKLISHQSVLIANICHQESKVMLIKSSWSKQTNPKQEKV